MNAGTISAIAAAAVAVITAVGTLLSHLQLRRQVNGPAAAPLPPPVTPRPPGATS